jgi:transcription elongation factor Elf1
MSKTPQKRPGKRSPLPPKPAPPKITPCPFCRFKNAQAVTNMKLCYGEIDPRVHLVVCACGACGPTGDTPQEAIAKWDSAWDKGFLK